MAIMEISIVPMGTGSVSISDYVAKAVRAANNAGFEAHVTPMGTIITGEFPALVSAAGEMHRAVLAGGVKRVITSIKIDERLDKKDDLDGRVREVERKASQ